jgi:hypothetical protein
MASDQSVGAGDLHQLPLSDGHGGDVVQLQVDDAAALSPKPTADSYLAVAPRMNSARALTRV